MHVHTIHTEYIYIYIERERERERERHLHWTERRWWWPRTERERERATEQRHRYWVRLRTESEREPKRGGNFGNEGRSSKGTRPAHFEAHIFLDFFFFFFNKKIWHINLFSYYYFTFLVIVSTFMTLVLWSNYFEAHI